MIGFISPLHCPPTVTNLLSQEGVVKTTNVGRWRYATRTIVEASRVLRQRKKLEYILHKRTGDTREMNKAKKEILDIDALKKPTALKSRTSLKFVSSWTQKHWVNNSRVV